MTKSRQILVYAPINYGIVDGSAIWLQSICKVLSLLPGTEVDLLAFAAPTDFWEPLDGVRNTWLPSHAIFTNSELSTLAAGDVLRPDQACDAIKILEQLQPYDYLVVRGREAAGKLAQVSDLKSKLIVYLTDVDEELLWVDEDRSEALQELRQTISKAALVLCQTPLLGALIEELAPEASAKIAYLPPMLPDSTFTGKRPCPTGGRLKMLYAGKFATEWATEEMIDVIQAIGGDSGPIDLHVYGDKFNKSKDGFFDRVAPRLEAQEGFTWHGAVSRKEMLTSMPDFDLGFAFRHATLDASPEISTKLIEYAASGVAPLLNRTPSHEAYFGSDYPLFANTTEELERVLRQVASGEIDLTSTLDFAQSKIQRHKMSNVAGLLERVLSRIEPVLPPNNPAHRPNLLIAGHDLKFMGDLKEKLFHRENFRINEVVWPRFQGGGEVETLAALQSAKIVFCEWALENAVFCSKNKQPDQTLIVRFHRFELGTPYPQRIQIENVDKIVTVSEHMASHLAQAYQWPANKIMVIPNSIDCALLDRPKTKSARFNLGMLGALPMLKRLDLAADLLEVLRDKDPRFMLHIKSKMPWDMPWIWNSGKQFSFYEKIFDRFRRNNLLRGAVQIDHHGPDVARWFQKIGWILSTSDVESFHLAGIEGMASGATPVVKDRLGAKDIFPEKYVFSDIESMAAMILETTVEANDAEGFAQLGVPLKRAVQLYDKEDVIQKWAKLLAPAING